MGLRHIIVVDGDLQVKGLITRSNLIEHRLEEYWEEEGEQIQNQMSVDSLPVAVAFDDRRADARSRALTRADRAYSTSSGGPPSLLEPLDASSIDMEIVLNDMNMPDSPSIAIRRRIDREEELLHQASHQHQPETLSMRRPPPPLPQPLPPSSAAASPVRSSSSDSNNNSTRKGRSNPPR